MKLQDQCQAPHPTVEGCKCSFRAGHTGPHGAYRFGEWREWLLTSAAGKLAVDSFVACAEELDKHDKNHKERILRALCELYEINLHR